MSLKSAAYTISAIGIFVAAFTLYFAYLSSDNMGLMNVGIFYCLTSNAVMMALLQIERRLKKLESGDTQEDTQQK